METNEQNNEINEQNNETNEQKNSETNKQTNETNDQIYETREQTPNEWLTQSNRRRKRKAGKPAKRESSLARVPLGKLCGAQRITKSVYYVGGMNPQCTAEDLRSFCSEFLEVIDCRVMPSSRYGTVTARLVVRGEDAHKTESINWPDHVFARPWKFSPTNNRTPSDRQPDPNVERTLTESLATGQWQELCAGHPDPASQPQHPAPFPSFVHPLVSTWAKPQALQLP